ncbi:MAG: hypothetical protein HS104_38615 [Polyangiaceae bacterium]|nr:hypothetical protein [Polyangiaceae bacterium]
MTPELRAALASVATDAECQGPFAMVTVRRDAAGEVAGFTYRGDPNACSAPAALYFDPSGTKLGAIGLRPVRDETDAAELRARHETLSAGKEAEVLGARELLEALQSESTRSWSAGGDLFSVVERYEWLALAALRARLAVLVQAEGVPRDYALRFERIARGDELELAGARRVFDAAEGLSLDELRTLLAEARESARPGTASAEQALARLSPWLGQLGVVEVAQRLDAIAHQRALAQRWRWLTKGDLVTTRPPPRPEATKGLRVLTELSYLDAYSTELVAWLRGDAALPAAPERHSAVLEAKHPLELERGGALAWARPSDESFLPSELAADLRRLRLGLDAAFRLASDVICDAPYRAVASLHSVMVTDLSSRQDYGPFVGSSYEKNRAMEPVVSPCGRFVAFADNDLEDYGGSGLLRLFELRTGRMVPLEEHAGLNALRAVSFAEDSSRLRALENFSNHRVEFDVRTGRRLG